MPDAGILAKRIVDLVDARGLGRVQDAIAGWQSFPDCQVLHALGWLASLVPSAVAYRMCVLRHRRPSDAEGLPAWWGES
jgi:hypothetical protein